MKSIVLLIIGGLIGLNLTADDKAPVAMDDYAEALVLQTVAIPVLENDFAYDDHPFKIQMIFGSQNGTSTFNDSIVFYTPKSFFRGIDSLRYRIIDLENNLMSPIAKIYIEVTNRGISHLDVNQVNCMIVANGLQFWDGNNSSGYEVPAGSGVHSIFSQSIWIGGFSQTGELHLAGERYKQLGSDYFSGPVSNPVHYDQDFDMNWFRVWKLNREDVEYHRANWNQAGYEPLEAIRDWPGNGDPALEQAAKLAPYYDWNGDGKYNAGDGDFPLIKGDQAIFTIFNDDRPHGETGGNKLGIEIQAMFYAYDQPDDSALSQTVFGDYTIINRSGNTYDDLLTGFFLDFDIGYYFDDYTGCDTLLHSGFAYNGNPVDGAGGAGTYGDRPPAQSFTCLNFEMDAFMHFNNTFSNPAMTDPKNAPEYYNFMKGLWRDSTQLTYGGNGYGGEVPTRFIFSGDPANPAEWSEVSEAQTPHDRRGLISSGPNTFNPADTLNFVFALVFARDYEGDHITSVTLLKERIQEIRDFYVNSLSVEEIKPQSGAVTVYPNPFIDQIFLQTSLEGETINWTVVDVLGKVVAMGKTANQPQLQINLQYLDKGVYFLLLNNGKSQVKQVIIKTD
jgi:hypothetical protein